MAHFVTLYDLEKDNTRRREFKTERDAEVYCGWLKAMMFDLNHHIPAFVITVES